MQPLWEIVWRFLKKLRIELPQDPVILLLGVYPKKKRERLIRKIYTPLYSVHLEAIDVPING